MKIRVNPLILGAFIVGAVALAVIALLALGSTNFFQPTGHFVFYLKDSAQGLGEGTAVNFEGVRIGQVDQVRILYDPRTRHSLVGVVCRINRNLLTDIHNRPIDLTRHEVLDNLVTNGLCAQVQTAGIVGAKFVELGFHRPSERLSLPSLPPAICPVLPTVPSTMTRVTDNISEILDHLRQTDFAGVASQLKGVLASAHGQIDELQTNQLSAHLSSAAASFDAFMRSPDLRDAVVHLRGAAAELQVLATNLNTQVTPLGGRLDIALTSLNQTARDLQDVLTLRNQLGEQTHDLLRQLDATARAVEQLGDFLQRHPNALITGREHAPGTP